MLVLHAAGTGAADLVGEGDAGLELVARLGSLADPESMTRPIGLEGLDIAKAIAFLGDMLLIRTAEEILAEKRAAGLIGGPIHLGVGQEAIAVGVSSCLEVGDAVYGAHRSHAHLIALGSPLRNLFSEVLGRDTGVSRGMGGSMHLWDESVGFFGSVPIVAGTVPLAVGAGLASRMRGNDNVGVAYLGDGAVEEGVVHESFNLAQVTGAQVLFVVENNFFASHMHISQRQSSDSTARFATANGLPSKVVDGNDVVAVSSACASLLAGIRQGSGPALIEAVTYRWYGHVDWRDDIDVGVNRSAEELTSWRRRDPVARLEDALARHGSWNEKSGRQLRNDLRTAAEAAWAQAVDDPFPPDSALIDWVYA